MEAAEQGLVIYSPTAVLNLFNNSIVLKEGLRMIRLRGVFVPGKGAFYNGSYYDSLRDELGRGDYADCPGFDPE